MSPKKAGNDFDAKDAITKVGDDLEGFRQANEGVNFDNKVKDSIARSTHVQKEIGKEG